MLKHVQARLISLLLALMALIAFPLPEAAAERPRATEQARSQARKLGKEGIVLLNQRRYKQAIERFERAEVLFHAPTHLLFIARARTKLGQLVAAHRAYAEVASESIPDYAPEAFHKAQQDARKELDKLSNKVPTILITVVEIGADAAKIRIDGRPLATAALAYPIALEPGEHSLEATAPASEPLSLELQLSAADRRKSVELRFRKMGSREPAPTGPTPQPEPEPEDDSASSLIAPAAVALSIGAAALIAGAVTGGLTLSQAAELKETCIDGHCPPEQQDNGERANLLGNVSTAMFVIGGVGAATGIVLLLVNPSDEPEADGDAAASPPRLQLRIGPSHISLAGTF